MKSIFCPSQHANINHRWNQQQTVLTNTTTLWGETWILCNEPVTLDEASERNPAQQRPQVNPNPRDTKQWVKMMSWTKKQIFDLIGKPAALMCMVSTIPQASSCMTTWRTTGKIHENLEAQPVTVVILLLLKYTTASNVWKTSTSFFWKVSGLQSGFGLMQRV